jgi:hypothetical protein
MVSADGLGKNCGELIYALGTRDDSRFNKALRRLADAAQQASPAEVQTYWPGWRLCWRISHTDRALTSSKWLAL